MNDVAAYAMFALVNMIALFGGLIIKKIEKKQKPRKGDRK